MKNYPKSLGVTALCAVIAGVSTLGLAQTVSTHHSVGSNNNWTANANWDTSSFPDSPEMLAQFGPLDDPEVDRVNINFGSTLLATPGVLDIGALKFLESFDSAASTFVVRNSNVNTAGALRLHGYDTMVGGSLDNITDR